MSANEPVSILSLAILGLVAQKPMSGYDLRKVFTTTPMGHYSNSPGAIYPALRRLERQGLVESIVERPHELRPRQVFAITEAGRKSLVAVLREPVTRGEGALRLDRLLLRFAFMDAYLERAEIVAFLEQLAEEVDDYVKYLRQVESELPGTPESCGRLALEHGIEGIQATARWARRAIKRIEDKEP